MTAVDYQIAGTSDDGNWDDLVFYTTTSELVGGATGYGYENMFARWTGVTIPNGATITSAYVSVYRYSSVGTPLGRLYFNDASNAVAPTNRTQAAGKAKTTAYITWNPPASGTWVNSGDCKTIIQELVDSYDYSSGAAMMMLWRGMSTGDNYCIIYDYSDMSSRAAKLHIEYTDPSPTYSGRSRSGFFKF